MYVLSGLRQHPESMQVCVLVVGLDNSGKSTVVNCLKVPRVL